MAVSLTEYLSELNEQQAARKAQIDARRQQLATDPTPGDVITTIRVMDQAEYDALLPNEKTLYLITE